MPFVRSSMLHDDSVKPRHLATTGAGENWLFDDDEFHLADPADNTKRARFDAGLVTAGQTRVVTLPNADVSLVPMVRSVTVTIPTAQVLALNATPQTLVAAPGAAAFIEFVSAHIFMDYNSSAYTGVAGAEDLLISYTNGSGQEVGRQETTGFIDQTSDQHRLVQAQQTAHASVSNIIPVANAALVVSLLSGEVAAGNSPLIIEVLYRVRTLAIS